MSFFIDIHALQTLPPSNINRDDTGAPKTAVFGGVPRQRVSSQAWKSAIRQDFAGNLDSSQLGLRTKRVAEKVVKKIQDISEEYDVEKAQAGVTAAFKTAGIKITPKVKNKGLEDEKTTLETGYLLLLSTQQINRLAQAIIDADGAKLTKKEVAEILDTQHSVDISLFGRMLADAPDFNVDASCQVAHAIGVHESEPEFDYYTAVDDVVREAEESGAGMIGTVEMMSSTLYRYANINLDGLVKNLDDKEAAHAAALQFIKSFISAMPTGKQNSFANRTLPEAVVVTLRDDRPVSYVNAFETPVKESAEHGRRVMAAQALAQEATDLAETYGLEPAKSYVLAVGELKESLAALGEEVNLKTLLDKLQADLAEVHTN
ncbi:type I-E CRISPR-associated protein Cas7/Cse4/CasC [Rothia sp. ZJ1223]|uniref:type I-E CRISPR-associated protein Cas7/Cse4/CasC n=1 Tax=Rothia sp. ZJ1223 TaxID=2811098 RepID=UPI00195E6487|nr:type I-E CRISPR-associated protein Cas7/Cse4/CasC [Rothia sp. ZJ1223]MBM7052134.1 type I-E CRISPR-associated protein Cas7/Cse4/CasC [Rothia sp. ZJ1223]